jgi:hypothetical protein
MAILNYTTKVPAITTVSEIQRTLAQKGAKAINVDYDNGTPIAIWFKIELAGTDIAFRLPSNVKGVESAMW